MDDRTQKQILEEVRSASTMQHLEDIRVRVVGKKGLLTQLFEQIKSSPDFKSQAQDLNLFKKAFLECIQERKAHFAQREQQKTLLQNCEDISLDFPDPSFLSGRKHPLTHTRYESMCILADLGFHYEEGPEIETEYYNFDALNFPSSHPARQMHDTFYLRQCDKKTSLPFLLRTHTSTVQIHAMENKGVPIRCMALGPTYRSDSDQTHTPQFHQLEGLCIEKDIHMGHLRWTLETFLSRFFEVSDLKIRFRPSYFPFTEPSLEVDVQCEKTKDAIKIGQGHDWLEILGCGMVHPHVLKNVGVDSDVYQGFAFGVGLDRLTMLKHTISDLRTLFEGHVGWLHHYGIGLF